MIIDLSGRVALVTGATRGLGLQIATGLARAGAIVLINSRDSTHVSSAVEQIIAEGLSARGLVFDVAREDEVDSAFSEIEGRFGQLDILVNNVGARLRISMEDVSTDAFSEILNTNLLAAFFLAKRAAALMAPRHWGRLIMLSSVAADRAPPGNIAYSAAKSGLNALTRSFAVEYGPLGITCNALAPGSFLTETNAQVLQGQVRKELEARLPLRRCGEPSDIAGPAVFLASDAASYITGQVLTVDGGFTACW